MRKVVRKTTPLGSPNLQDVDKQGCVPGKPHFTTETMILLAPRLYHLPLDMGPVRRDRGVTVGSGHIIGNMRIGPSRSEERWGCRMIRDASTSQVSISMSGMRDPKALRTRWLLQRSISRGLQWHLMIGSEIHQCRSLGLEMWAPTPMEYTWDRSTC